MTDEFIKDLEKQSMILYRELSALRDKEKIDSESLKRLQMEVEQKIIANNKICDAIQALKSLNK